MSKRINLNPRILGKKKSKGYENQIMIIVYILLIVGIFFYSTYLYIDSRNLLKEKNTLQIETQGLNFQSNNADLANKITEKNNEIKYIESLQDNINYYSEIDKLKVYEPEGITIKSVTANGNNISITGTSKTSEMVPVFLENLKKSKEYSTAFLQNMQNVIEKVPINKNLELDKSQNNNKTTSKTSDKKVSETIFVIQIGGNTNESNGAS